MQNLTKNVIICASGSQSSADWIAGIMRWVRSHPQLKWNCAVSPPMGLGEGPLRLDRDAAMVKSMDGYLLCPSLSKEQVAFISSIDKPMVTIETQIGDCPCVLPDNHAIGRAAADHLASAQFASATFVGISEEAYSRERQSGFETRWKELGKEWIEPPSSQTVFGDPRVDRPQLGAWLCEQAGPFAVFCDNGLRASWIRSACTGIGLEIPGEVGILGVDVLAAHTDLSSPTLSMVDTNREEMGFRGAGLLNRLMQGETLETKVQLVQPAGIVERISTNPAGYHDEHVRKALQYVRERLDERILVEDVARAAGVSRRKLEMLFKDNVGRGVHEELRRLRHQTAVKLLVKTDLTVTEIALDCGYSSSGEFSRSFKQFTGMKPSEYRDRV